MNSLRLLGLLCLLVVLVLVEVTVSTDVGELQGVMLFDSPQTFRQKAKTFTIKKDKWKFQVENSKKTQQSF